MFRLQLEVIIIDNNLCWYISKFTFHRLLDTSVSILYFFQIVFKFISEGITIIDNLYSIYKKKRIKNFHFSCTKSWQLSLITRLVSLYLQFISGGIRIYVICTKSLFAIITVTTLIKTNPNISFWNLNFKMTFSKW